MYCARIDVKINSLQSLSSSWHIMSNVSDYLNMHVFRTDACIHSQPRDTRLGGLPVNGDWIYVGQDTKENEESLYWFIGYLTISRVTNDYTCIFSQLQQILRSLTTICGLIRKKFKYHPIPSQRYHPPTFW